MKDPSDTIRALIGMALHWRQRQVTNVPLPHEAAAACVARDEISACRTEAPSEDLAEAAQPSLWREPITTKYRVPLRLSSEH